MSEPAWVRNHKGRVFSIPYPDDDGLPCAVHLTLLGGGPFIAYAAYANSDGCQYVTVRSDTKVYLPYPDGRGAVSLHAGETSLVPMEWLRKQGEHEIPTAECPSCGIDDMIFYNDGDYICAWCREMLEESCG